MVSRIIAYAALVFVPIINTRTLTVAHYGYYKQFHLLFETLSPLLILGFPMSLQYYLPRAESQREKSIYVAQTLGFLFASSMLAILTYYTLGHTLGEGIGAMTRAFYWRLCAFTGLMMMSDYMESLFAAERETGRQAIYHASFSTLQSGTVIAMAWIYRDVSAMVWGLTVFALARFIFVLGYTFVRYRPSLLMLSIRTIREQLSFALPVGLFGIVLILLNQTDKFIINRFIGREGFAIYAVGAFQLPFVNMISQSVRNVMFPLMSQKQKLGEYAEVARIWRRAAIKMSALYFPLFVLFEASAPSVIRTLFTETYADATPIFMIYLALMPQVATDSVAILQVFKDTAYLLKTFTVAFLFNLVLSLFLFETIGREGVPLGTIITMYSVNIINMVFASRRCQVPFHSFVPVRAVAARLVAAAIPGIPLWWLCRHYADNIVIIGVLGVAYFAVYLMICRSTGLLTWLDMRSLLGRGGREV